MIFDRARCAWVKWTGTRAAWLTLPAASAIVVSACLPVIGARMPMGPAHRAAYGSKPLGKSSSGKTSAFGAANGGSIPPSPIYPVTPPPLDYVGTPIAYLPSLPPALPSLIVPPNVPAQPVPEPGSLALFATAVAALGAVRRMT